MAVLIHSHAIDWRDHSPFKADTVGSREVDPALVVPMQTIGKLGGEDILNWLW